MKKLYFVEVTFEGSETLAVMAVDEDSAKRIADHVINESDVDMNKSFYTRLATACPKWATNDQIYNLDEDDGRDCEEIISDQEKEKRRLEAEALEPKLPGFGS